MPKVVDPAARRLEVVDALFRVAIRDGLQQASLRNVADEAGLNIGSVRHYFATHQELMLFAMRSMVDRVSGRLLRHVDAAANLGARPRPERREVVAGLLEELLPLDDVRRAEVTVFVEFATAARTNPALAGPARDAAVGTRALIGRVLAGLARSGALRAGIDLETETVRLWALLDGLGFNAVLHPELVSAADCVAALRAHLDGLEPDGADGADGADGNGTADG
ncbi:TetR/AcrR family transcriptional regulator [Streptomyces sp. G-G2]|uniref:TetR/AcrR family transcriptional regulator n=1 Tax=Streptomyces sp. G-G2 TaxID=3046201 RepID=UPI0024BB5D21|nr:TetR/AcrR family transcriptional regulator [Streptomyces sp. G-G2]MDJ0380318.1 TetR/AcrR family transcriptional regulator [Streptomyces sp. G-G2]